MKIIAIPYQPDIFLVGGGTEGSAVVVAAAKRGYRVQLIAESNCPGGVSTAGGVIELYVILNGLGDIFDRLITELDNYGALRGCYFTSEYLKLIWQFLAMLACVKRYIPTLFYYVL